MKSNLLFICLFLFPVISLAQFIQWEKSLGGSSFEIPYSIKPTTDGGSIVVGTSYSNNGDITNSKGGGDYWIVKISSTGIIQWQKSYGGSDEDNARSVLQTSDGGYIIGGYTLSNDGDVTINNGGYDYWIIKLDSNGNLIWEKSFGGTQHDYGYSFNIIQTSDGGYIFAGSTYSNDGDVTLNNGNQDVWIVRLTSTGSLAWQKSFGGSDSDVCTNISSTIDGGFVICGNTSSNDFDVSGNNGFVDFWVVKFNSFGNLVWQKCLGGSNEDTAKDISQTSDGGFIVVGNSNSSNGHLTGNNGSYDIWLVKLDSIGNIVWQRNLGGSGYEDAWSVKQTVDGGYIIAGTSNSTDGVINGNIGGADYWIVKTDSLGAIQWQKNYGGSTADQATGVYQASNGNYIIAGTTASSNTDVTINNGSNDYWIINLGPNLSINEIMTSKSLIIFPNPTNNFITIRNGENTTENFNYKIIDLLGRVVKKGNLKFNEQINIESLENGNYIIQINTKNRVKLTEKIIKN
jgi:hypothetical protein